MLAVFFFTPRLHRSPDPDHAAGRFLAPGGSRSFRSCHPRSAGACGSSCTGTRRSSHVQALARQGASEAAHDHPAAQGARGEAAPPPTRRSAGDPGDRRARAPTCRDGFRPEVRREPEFAGSLDRILRPGQSEQVSTFNQRALEQVAPWPLCRVHAHFGGAMGFGADDGLLAAVVVEGRQHHRKQNGNAPRRRSPESESRGLRQFPLLSGCVSRLGLGGGPAVMPMHQRRH